MTVKTGLVDQCYAGYLNIRDNFNDDDVLKWCNVMICWGSTAKLCLYSRVGGQGGIAVPQRVQQAVGQAVTQAAVNELANAFTARFK